VREGDFLFTLDFQDGFFHMEVHPDHQRLLGIKWRGVCYAYHTFPFGLSALLWIFTRRLALTCPLDVVLDTDASLSGWGAALKDLNATSVGWW
jgi:hypothetical protein